MDPDLDYGVSAVKIDAKNDRMIALASSKHGYVSLMIFNDYRRVPAADNMLVKEMREVTT